MKKSFEPTLFMLKPFPNGSSNLMGYDYHDGILTIQFKYGKTYQYNEVPQEVVDALLSAESHGKYFNEEVKGKYDYITITL